MAYALVIFVFCILGSVLADEDLKCSNVTTMGNDITLNGTQTLTFHNCTLWMKEHTITLHGYSVLNITQCEIREITRRSNIGGPMGRIHATDNSLIILEDVEWGFDYRDWIDFKVTGIASLWIEDSHLSQETAWMYSNGIVVKTAGQLYINSSDISGISTGDIYPSELFIAGQAQIENTWLRRWQYSHQVRNQVFYDRQEYWYPSSNAEIPERMPLLVLISAAIPLIGFCSSRKHDQLHTSTDAIRLIVIP